jgi:hypothetical protein
MLSATRRSISVATAPNRDGERTFSCASENNGCSSCADEYDDRGLRLINILVGDEKCINGVYDGRG